MQILKLILDEDKTWPDLQEENCIYLGEGPSLIQVAVLKRGMKSGLPSVVIRLDLPDGEVVIAETSAVLFVAAGKKIEAKFPELLKI